MKKLLLLLVILITFSLTSKSNDSLLVSKENSVELLNYKFDSLEKSTDRILNALYITISLILASVIGLNIWNWITQNRKYSQEIDKQIIKTKEELEKNFNDKVKEIQSTLNNNIESKIRSIKSDIVCLKMDLIIQKSEYMEYSTDFEPDLIVEYIQLAQKYDELTYSGDFRLKQAFLGLEKYIKEDGYFYHTVKDELIKKLSSTEFESYKNYTEKIIKLLKEKDK